MSPTLFRKTVKWFGLLILAHIVSLLIYGPVLSNTVISLLADGDRTAVSIVMIYNVIFNASFVALCLRFRLSYDDKDIGKEIKEDVKNNSFSVIKYFKTEMLKEHLVKIGVVAIFQLPLIILFSVWKLAPQFYVMDWGCYMLTGSAILGWLLNTLMFAAVFTLVVLLHLLITKKDIKKNGII